MYELLFPSNIDYDVDADLASDHNDAYLLNPGIGDPWKDTIKPWTTTSVEAKRLYKLSEKCWSELHILTHSTMFTKFQYI
jgi:hypothetical protein